ncbi:MAG: hypothetical protein FVQ81_12030 [Candidatus Glassbacteria bacterium]|nr:hypothetical protein [Candidatus Glassbacteria bacterium]
MNPARSALTALFCFVLIAGAQAEQPGEEENLDRRVAAHFFALSDLAAEALSGEPTTNDNYRDPGRVRAYPQYFVDSYAVRALAVAADLTGSESCRRACRSWADRMLADQAGMAPAGAYYMNYHRKPGETAGQWFVADCGSIAMGVLAVAVRCTEPEFRDRYLESVESFIGLVMDNYVRPSGGITDGIWNKSDDEWWCSTCLVTALAFQLHGITGERKYLDTALAGIDWLLGFEYDDTILYDFEDGAPTTVFYVLEAYAAALPYLARGSVRRQKVIDRLSASVEWMADTQNAEGTWDYNPDNWGVKLGGLPCHMLIYGSIAQEDRNAESARLALSGRLVPLKKLVGESAAKALDYFSGRKKDSRKFTQQDAFTMMSYAELLCPGELYSKTGREFPFTRNYPKQQR